MKAVEIISNTDKEGLLKIEYKLSGEKNHVRVIILYDDESKADDGLGEDGLAEDYVTGNPAFDFLNDPEEDIYTLDDGNPVK